MRISDWSSDVCSSDLGAARPCPYRWRDTRFRFGLRCAHPRARLIMSSIALEVARAHMSGRSFDHINDLLVNALRAHPDKESEEHTSELQSLMRISYAVFCLKKKKTQSSTTSNKTAL